MRRKILMGLCLAVLISFAAGDYLFNFSRGGQEPPTKVEPPEKKDDLFDILKKSLEAKSEPSALPPLPAKPPDGLTLQPDGSFKREIPANEAPKDKDIAIPPFNPALGSPPLAPVSPPAKDEKPVAVQSPPVTTPPPPPPGQSTEPVVQPKPPSVPMIVEPPQEGQNKQTGYPKQAFDAPEDPARTAVNPPKGFEVKPVIGAVNPSLGSSSAPPPPPVTVVSPIKAKSSPWRLNVEVVEGQTIVTATVNKKHEFKIVCQSLDLQTGTNSFKASGKVQISGDALSGHCERLTISLTDDRLVLEGAAELSIQKTVTTVSSDDGKPAAFELKGETLNLRISELQSGKFLQTSWRASNADVGADKTIVGATKPDGKQWSPYGTLRRSKTENGSAWRLENAAGHPMLHLLTSGDRVLEQYEGRTISVIGPAVDKMTVRVTHIAVP